MFKLLILLFYLVPSFSYADSTVGESLFNRNCATCHKRTAPNIIGTKLNSSTFLMIVKNGRAGTMMGSFKSKFSELGTTDLISLSFWIFVLNFFTIKLLITNGVPCGLLIPSLWSK